jgi:hypothetical protein
MTSAAASQASVASAAPVAPRPGASSASTARLTASETPTWIATGRIRPAAISAVPSTPPGAIRIVASARTASGVAASP